MNFARASGILLHPTSFPGPYGIGDLGEGALRWLDFLVEAGQTLWQVMPLGYTGFGDSPYQSVSAFAGDPLLISIDTLRAQGLLTHPDIGTPPPFAANRVDYGPVIIWKTDLLRKASGHFYAQGGAGEPGFQAFVRDNAQWLEDLSFFLALKEAHEGAPWSRWELPLRRREPAAMEQWTSKLVSEIALHKFLQYAFVAQWRTIRAYANANQIKVIGDIPIFVGYDSADVWANPGLFEIDSDGKQQFWAGAPPDYFSPTGQVWGNPLYRWDVLARRGYDWWIRRFRCALAEYDILRLDHFRGFEASWAVPSGDRTAINGHWEKGPGRDFFMAVKTALGDLPVVAEDLGVTTPELLALRDELGFAGMKVLQFAFGGDPSSPYLPHNYPAHCMGYSGTHDNDTFVGWYKSASEKERDFFRQYTGRDDTEVNWVAIRLLFGSVAQLAVVPLQDVLGLGSEARMNVPGTAAGNWGFRYRQEDLTPALARRLKDLTCPYGRCQALRG